MRSRSAESRVSCRPDGRAGRSACASPPPRQRPRRADRLGWTPPISRLLAERVERGAAARHRAHQPAQADAFAAPDRYEIGVGLAKRLLRGLCPSIAGTTVLRASIRATCYGGLWRSATVYGSGRSTMVARHFAATIGRPQRPSVGVGGHGRLLQHANQSYLRHGSLRSGCGAHGSVAEWICSEGLRLPFSFAKCSRHTPSTW
jgi:hypothetical protein